MDDTRPEIAEKFNKMFQERTPEERCKMGSSMYDTAKYIAACAIREEIPIYSAAKLRQELFLRFYRDDFNPITRQKILDHLEKTSVSNAFIKNPNLSKFDHIPNSEKKQKWWELLYPIIEERLGKENVGYSKLLKMLVDTQKWRQIKNSIEIALKNVTNGESILARASEIKDSPTPDTIIDTMCGELRTIPYLLIKGFTKINYLLEEGIDFKAECDGKAVYIESAYVHGADFNT